MYVQPWVKVSITVGLAIFVAVGLSLLSAPPPPLRPTLSSPLIELSDVPNAIPDYAKGMNFRLLLTSTHGLANPINVTDQLLGMQTYIYFVQDAAGQHQISNWGSVYKLPGRSTNPVLSYEPHAVDRLVCFIRAIETFDCIFSGGYL